MPARVRRQRALTEGSIGRIRYYRSNSLGSRITGCNWSESPGVPPERWWRRLLEANCAWRWLDQYDCAKQDAVLSV